MRYRLIEKEVESLSVTTGRNSPTIDVANGDMVTFQMVASAASSPGSATIQLFGSLDGTNFVAVGSTVAISGNGVFALSDDNPAFRYYRVTYVIASGSYTSTLRVLVKGDLD